MKHFAKDLAILHKAVRLYGEEKKAEQPGAESLLHMLGDMFAEESGTVVSVWVSYNDNTMTFPKDGKENEEYRGELRDYAEEKDGNEGFSSDSLVYFMKVKTGGKESYGVAVRFREKLKEGVREEIALAARTVFMLPKAVFERDRAKKKLNPLGLPELTYYKENLRGYDGAMFLRPKGFSSMAWGIPDRDGLDPLMGLYREYMEIIRNCRELSGNCDFAFDSWALVVLVKRGCSGLMHLNSLMEELSELGVGEAYEVQKNVFVCTGNHVMNLGDLLLISMEMNKNSIAGATRAYPSVSSLQKMRDERLKKDVDGNNDKGLETYNGDFGTDKGGGADNKETSPEESEGDGSVYLDDALDVRTGGTIIQKENESVAGTEDKGTLMEENKSEGSGISDAHILEEMFPDGSLGG